MKKLKIMSAILAVIMTFGLCACGKDGGNSASDAPTTSATTVAPTDTATTTAAAADEFITTGKSVKITIPKLENTVKIDNAKFEKAPLFLTENTIPSTRQLPSKEMTENSISPLKTVLSWVKQALRLPKS